MSFLNKIDTIVFWGRIFFRYTNEVFVIHQNMKGYSTTTIFHRGYTCICYYWKRFIVICWIVIDYVGKNCTKMSISSTFKKGMGIPIFMISWKVLIGKEEVIFWRTLSLGMVIILTLLRDAILIGRWCRFKWHQWLWRDLEII